MGEKEQRLSGRNGRDGAGVEWEGWGEGAEGSGRGGSSGGRGEEQHSSSWSMGI